MGYMSYSPPFTDYDGDGTRDGILRQLNVGTGLTGSLINGVLSLEVTGGQATVYDGTITLTAGTNMTGGGNFTTNQNPAEEITFNGLSNAQIQALFSGVSPIQVSSGVVSFTGGLNDLSDVSIASAAEGEALVYNGTNWVNQSRDNAFIRVKNDTTSTLNKGLVVYVSGPHNANLADVELARANAASTMPAIGVLYQDLSPGDEGLAVAYGKAAGMALPSPTFSEGDTVYVSTSVAGGVTNTKPTGASDLIQNVGIVMKTHATNGVLFVTGVGRSNDVPNSFSITGSITAGSFVKSGGASSEFLKADGSVDTTTYLTTESNDLTAAVTWANVPNANITESSVTQHQAALSITESQISDLQSYHIGTLAIADGGTGATTAAAARTALGVDAAGTDNSTDVTLATVTDNYLSIAGQVITAGTVPVSLGGTGATTASAARTALGVDAAGTDNSTDVTLATVTDNYLSIAGQVITAGTVPVSLGGTGATTASAARTALGVDAAGTDNSTDVTLATVTDNYLSIAGQVITAGTVPVSLGGTGATTASAARTALGVDAAGTDNSTDVTLATVASNYLSLSGQEITAGTVPVALGGTGSTTASAARTALGLAIGSDVQAYDADLTTLAGLTSTNDSTFIVGSATGWVVENATTARTSLGLGTAATQDVGNFLVVANNLNDIASASAARTNLGLAIGSDVQAYDADLTTLAGLSSADGNFIVGSASGWVVESGATARTSLGLGSAATSDTGDFATAAQGTKADTAHGWGDHGAAGYLTAEADTLDDVVGRGSSTTSAIVVGGLTVDTNTLAVDTVNNRVGIGTSSPKTAVTVEGSVTFKEQAAADTDTAAYGQLWVKTATPNELYFTTDAGDDIQITSGTSIAGGGGGSYTDAEAIAAVEGEATLDLTGDVSLAANKELKINESTYSASAKGTADTEVLVSADSTGTNDALFRIDTTEGFLRMGPQNSGYCHFYTDRNAFYFNRNIEMDGGSFYAYNDDLQIKTDDSGSGQPTRIFIDAGVDDCRVGIGNGFSSSSLPTNSLHVKTTETIGDDAYAARFQSAEGNVGITRYGGIHINNDNTSPTDGAAWDTDRWQISERDGNSFDIAHGTPSNTNVAASATSFRITTGGNVGIGLGNTNPSTKLHVNGTIRQTGATSAVLAADSNGDIGAASALTNAATQSFTALPALGPPAPPGAGDATHADLTNVHTTLSDVVSALQAFGIL